VGAGGSQDAEFTLLADLPAGTWHLVADGIVLQSVDVRFELIRRPAGGGADVPIASWDHHFDPLPSGFDAQPFEVSAEGEAQVGATGDQLILRFTGTNSTQTMAYIPNGDGELAHGRIPYIDLPAP